MAASPDKLRPPLDFARFSQFASLLGSRDEAEARSALRGANRMLSAAGLSWADVLSDPLRRTGAGAAPHGEGPGAPAAEGARTIMPCIVDGLVRINEEHSAPNGTPWLVVYVVARNGDGTATYGPISVYDHDAIAAVRASGGQVPLRGIVRRPNRKAGRQAPTYHLPK